MREILIDCLDQIECSIADGNDSDTIIDALERICEVFDEVQRLFLLEAGMSVETYIERRILTETYMRYKDSGDDSGELDVAQFTADFQDAFNLPCSGDYVEEDLQPAIGQTEPRPTVAVKDLDSIDCEDDKTALLTAIKDMQAAGVDCDYDSNSNILYIDWDPLEAITDLLQKD